MGNLFTDDDASMVEEVREDDGDSYAVAAPRDVNEDEFYADVSSLPDISGFSDSFHDRSFEDEDGGSEGETPIDSDSDSPLSLGSGQGSPGGSQSSDLDPEEIAKALRTVLKRDRT